MIGSREHFDPERMIQQTGDAYDRCFNLAGVARQLCAAAASGSRTAQLHDVTVPTLVMHGDVDNLIDISGGVRTAESIPGARFVSPGRNGPRPQPLLLGSTCRRDHEARRSGHRHVEPRSM